MSTIRAFRILSSILFPLCFSSCVRRIDGAAPIAISAADREQRVFGLMSSFYCAERRWPESWEEFSNHVLLKEGALGPAAEFGSPALSSPRALVLIVKYVPITSDGVAAKARKVTFIAPPSCDPSPPSDSISILGGRVSFQGLDGFAVLSGEQVKERWGKGPYPDVAWEQPESGVVVALRFGEASLTHEQLKQFKVTLEAAFRESVKGLVWISRNIDTSSIPNRLVHEFESDSSRGRLVTETMSLSFDSRLFTINVIGPTNARKEIETTFDRVNETLTLK